MIAAATSSLSAYFANDSGKDVELIDLALEQGNLYLPPVVLSELLSDPHIPKSIEENMRRLPILTLDAGYWERAGELRRTIISKKFKARLADALIAQICIDHKAPLITRDQDFIHFAKYGGLVLAL